MVTAHLLDELTHALWSILHEHRYADRVIERLLRGLPSRDQRRELIAQTVYGVLRHLRRLVWLTGQQETFTQEQLQLCIRYWWVLANVPLSKSLRSGIPPRQDLRHRWEKPPSRAIRYSVPDWLDQYGFEQCGNRWEQFLAAIENEPSVVVRTNTLLLSREQLKELLAAKGIASTPHHLAPEALVLTDYVNVFALEEFHKGYFEMQDAASQAIGHLLRVEPSMRVVDACAGNGGKALHLAALMHNRGRIIALDTESWKLDQLRKRAARAGVSIIETRPITSTKVIKRLSGSADCLLLDVPCSGSGVWRRNPDGKWHLQPPDIPHYQQIQRRILNSYLSMLSPQGVALYCTCSIFPAEGEHIIAEFCASHPQWKCSTQGRFEPWNDQCDGFFWALLRQQ